MSPQYPLPVIAGLKLGPVDGHRLPLRFAYHPDTVARIKQVAGRRWHAGQKCWSEPYTEEALQTLQRLFGEDPIHSFTQPALGGLGERVDR